MVDVAVLAPLLEVGVGALALLLGILVYVKGRDRLVNVFLAGYLVFNGLGPLGILRGVGRLLWEDAPGTARGLAQAAGLAEFAYPGLYLAFASLALQSRWVAWLRRPAVRWSMIVGPFAVGGYFLLGATTSADFEVLDKGLIAWIGVVCSLSLIAAIDDWRQADPTVRRRASMYLASFGIIDLTYLAALSLLAFAPAVWDAAAATMLLTMMILLLIGFLALAYTVLSGQIIDLERSLHFGISRTTIAAIFVATFIGVQEVLSEIATATAGYVAGGIATVGLVFAIGPIQRLANGVANRAAPSMDPHRLDDAQLEAIYREQVEVAWEDGSVSAKDTRSLGLLRARLGLSAAVAGGIEVEVRETVLAKA